MARAFAFLRAINVGGRTVTMDRLRELFEGMGFDGVATFIASGNVVLDGLERELPDRPVAESRIEAALEDGLGYPVATFLRSRDELRTIARCQPFEPRDGAGTLYVGFARGAPDEAASARLHALASGRDDVRVAGSEVYWRPAGLSRDSTLSGAALEKALGGPLTLRNMNTVTRLLRKFGDD